MCDRFADQRATDQVLQEREYVIPPVKAKVPGDLDHWLEPCFQAMVHHHHGRLLILKPKQLTPAQLPGAAEMQGGGAEQCQKIPPKHLQGGSLLQLVPTQDSFLHNNAVVNVSSPPQH